MSLIRQVGWKVAVISLCTARVHSCEASTDEHSITVIDSLTGLEPFMARDSIQARATQLTASLLTRCDVAVLLLDAR